MSTTKVAVVTGANKGIGFAIVKGLCERFEGKVYLTSRNEERGLYAVDELRALGLNPYFHQLDIDDQNSINQFRDDLIEVDGGIDILINNAAIMLKIDDPRSNTEQAAAVIKTNYFSTLNVCESLFPIIRPNGRVVNISSSGGHLSAIPSFDYRAKLSSPTLTVKELSGLMDSFLEKVKQNNYIQWGWGNSAYRVSKVALSALTIIQQRELDSDPIQRNITINSVHPGYVDTDLTDHKGILTIEEGASAPLYLALEAHGLRGQYVWFNSKVVNWYAPTLIYA